MHPLHAFGTLLGGWLRLVSFATGLCLLAGATVQRAPEIAQGVISRMEHVSVDYPYVVRGGEVLDTAEYQGLREYATESLALLEGLPSDAQQSALVAQARRVLAGIDARAPGPEVAGPARALAGELVRIYHLTLAPRQTPDLGRARALYGQECAVCHGPRGRGDGPASATLQPRPGDFLDPARMAGQSILDLYGAITTGVAGRPGHGAHLPFADRWALAFLVSSLRDPPDVVRRGEALWRTGQGQAQLPDLRGLVLQTPEALEREGGDALDAVRAFLTLHPEALETSRPAGLVLARTRLRESVAAYARGDVDAARQLALAAHVEGIAPIAARIDDADPVLRREIAGELQALRSAIDRHLHAGTVAAHATRLERLLDRAADRLERGTRAASAVYLGALLVLLREGTEAILVLAAILAVARKTGRPEVMRRVHAGWMLALVLGAATWFAAGELLALAGTGREVNEGVATLLAAAMLLYVGWWLHQRARLDAWHSFIDARLQAAAAPRTLWAMVGLSFLALYRELFEVIVMVQALWSQAGREGQRAVTGGLATAAVLLAGVAWAVVHYGARLPVARFQAITSALLLAMALVFVGHGISALQEAGVVPVTTLGSLALPLLGVHPTAQGLGAQLLVMLLIAVGIVLHHRDGRR